MKNENSIPHIIQKLLEDGGPPDKAEPCDVCGEEDTISLIDDHIFYDDKYKLEIVIPTYVCSHCGDESYPDASYQHILQQVEIAKGNSYMKVEVKEGGRILKYAVH